MMDIDELPCSLLLLHVVADCMRCHALLLRIFTLILSRIPAVAIDTQRGSRTLLTRLDVFSSQELTERHLE